MERELIGVISATITGMMKMLSLIGVISALIFIITGRFKNVEDLFSLMMMMFLCSLDPQVLDVSGFECKMDLVITHIYTIITIILLGCKLLGCCI
jgi:uncharacterized membrane protein